MNMFARFDEIQAMSHCWNFLKPCKSIQDIKETKCNGLTDAKHAQTTCGNHIYPPQTQFVGGILINEQCEKHMH